MNQSLKPVFDKLLTKLESEGIDYWVYGGVSIAAYAGYFIRKNKDVDIFVKEDDFKKAKLLFKKINSINDYECKCVAGNRPKIKIMIDNKERLSVIPVYLDDGTVLFKYPDGNKIKKYNYKILKRIERKLNDYRFFTPDNSFIKQLFINHIEARSDKKERPEIQQDAKAILSPQDFSYLNWK